MSRISRRSLEDFFGKPEQEDKTPGEDRLVLLCDGIFAIAITLLVLDIKLPPIPEGTPNPASFVHDSIMELLPKIIIYLITFFIIANYWQGHRVMMRYIQRLDSRFIWLTFLFLAFIVFFPVAFNIASEYSSYPEGVIVYTLSMVGCGFTSQLLWMYASWNQRLTGPEVNFEMIVSRSIHSLLVPVYFCLSLLLLFIPFFSHDPTRIYWSWVFIPVFSALIHLLLRPILGPGYGRHSARDAKVEDENVEGDSHEHEKIGK